MAAPEDGVFSEAALHDRGGARHLSALPREPAACETLHVRRGEHLQLQPRARAREAA